jgi:hypothetical protein
VANFGTEGGGIVGSGAKIDVGTGKYKGRIRLGGTKEWIPAPPGAFPGVRTSLLRNSVRFVSPEKLGTPLRSAFGTATRYGRYLELGTARMAARPWIVRSAIMAKAQMQQQFVRASSVEFKKAGITMGAA